MTAKTSLLSLLFCLLLCFADQTLNTASASTPEIQTFYSTVQSSDQSFEQFLEEEVGVPGILLYQQGWLEKIREWNPGIEKNASLPIGYRVYIELPYGTFLTPHKKEAVVAEQPQNTSIIFEEKPRKSEFLAKRLDLKAFYALSMGSFSQTSNNGSDFVNSDQNTPIQLGVNSLYRLNSNDQILAGLSFSKLNRAQVKDTNENLDLPWEYNLDLFYQRVMSKGIFLPYLGLSFEKISSYNVSDFSVSAGPLVLESSQIYLSLGAQYKFEVWSRALLANFQFSPILNSSSSQTLLTTQESFSGQRIQLKFELLNQSSWGYFVGYSLHRFTGPTDLSISRFGIGFSYSFL